VAITTSANNELAAAEKTAQETSGGQVYVWEIPVRLTHWVNVVCIVVLSFTGYYIGNPYIEVSAREVYSTYFMGLIRFIHFAAAYIFVGSIALRTYWAFVGGNRWANWRALVPFFTPEGRGKLQHALKYYLFLRRDPPTTLGHNALAGLTYAWIVFLYFVQIITGFALYGQAHPGSLWWNLTSWIFLFIDNQHLRLAHHMVMWLLIAFALHHVYSAFLVDAEEVNGLLSSIFTGWKFICPNKTDKSRRDK
jgi:Ni/Fe-hydrogenase 1 B-type cytochrome subunit